MLIGAVLIFGLLAITPGDPLNAPWPGGAFTPRPSRLLEGRGAEGSARLIPDSLAPAVIGSYTFEFTVGAAGIAPGGALMVAFPKTWFTNPVPYPKPVQTTHPEAFHYVGAVSSRAESKLEVSMDQINFDGKSERFCRTIIVTVRDAPLLAGDIVSVTLANTTAPYIAGWDAVYFAVDSTGDGEFAIGNRADYTVNPGEAVTAILTAPSDAQVGQEIPIQLTLFDRFYNVAKGAVGEFTIFGLSDGPMPSRVTPSDDVGVKRVYWTPTREGYYFPETRFGDIEVFGGPIRVSTNPPANRVYWGDLHSHSRISKDGIGSGDFSYARDVARLDFFASTEHDVDDGGGDSITPAEWTFLQNEVRGQYMPGTFVTLLGYESSIANGHHNVFYRDIDGLPWPGFRMKTVQALWSRLRAGNAITIPHHLGILWGGFEGELDGPGLQPVRTARRTVGGPKLDWTLPHDPVLRPVLEMYSEHGTSEYFDPNDPLAYEQVRFTPARSADGPHYARDAWAAGLRMGAVAASDNHVAHPGLAHTGLTAVFAPELTREAIFDALAARRSYATTGERILVDFEVNGAPMGQESPHADAAAGRFTVAAPTEIKFVEVLAFDFGGTAWRTVVRLEPRERIGEGLFNDEVPDAGAVYYLRAELVRPTGDRVARAWSSPVWVAPKN